MNEASSAVSPADIADTGLWRLDMRISETGMSACLRPAGAVETDPVPLFDVAWERDADSLLSNIENCVYDHPRVLDDYATEIVVVTPRSLQIPREAVDGPGDETDFYREVWDVAPDDIMTDDNGESLCVYSLAPGLPSFLRRTLPGARTRCHLSILADRFRGQHSELTRIYADIRRDEADILAFRDETLLAASTQPWRDPADITYRILLLMKALGLSADSAEVRLAGEAKSEVAAALRSLGGYASFFNA